jgi:hypothetical protein
MSVPETNTEGRQGSNPLHFAGVFPKSQVEGIVLAADARPGASDAAIKIPITKV